MEHNRKELVSNYKNRKVVGGVYKVTNSKTNNYWIGSSVDVDKIVNRFDFAKSTNMCFSLEMQKDWDKYGANTFSIEIIERLGKKAEQEEKEFKEEITLLEKMWKSKQ